MKSLIPIVSVSILSAVLVGTACAADVQEKREEVKEAQKELRQETNKKMMEVSRASKIIGTDVKNTRGDSLGDIKDLVLDPLSGNIVYAVVSYGGVLGMGSKLFAIPWSVLRWSRDKDYYVLDMDKDTLKKAPGFDKDHWPDSLNKWEQQREEINQFYHINP
jgi:sporulation protein YlmC with PRC-barrel domain